VAIRVTDDGYQLREVEVAPGACIFEFENTGTRRAAPFLVELPVAFAQPTPPHIDFAPFLTGKRVLGTQTFRDLFRGQATIGAEGLSIRDLTVLFTDLKGSTELYERIGDLSAFALVQAHFEWLRVLVLRHEGAVVKTIGDAVMATFPSPLQAVRAALEMLDDTAAFNRAHGPDDLVLKIGIHSGPSIAVTLNDRVDYFGQTVNVAARVQALADGHELCITDEVYRGTGVEDALCRSSSRAEGARLKGIARDVPVRRVTRAGG
jgi:class 3 adenylate cyclase